MGLFSRSRQQRPASWYPARASCCPDNRPTVLYFNPDMPGAVIAVAACAVTARDGLPRVQVTVDWQVRRPPHYIAADVEWHLSRSELLASPGYESHGEATADAAAIVKWLVRGASPADLMPDLDGGIAALICNWDGQPFEQDAEAV